MIQELFGGGAPAGILGGEKKIATSGGLPSPSPSSSTATTPDAAPKTSENQNLKCPRCDSPNTKFCYYNNYNLTQPRHFCKTCRRYWTKGGALRNVPIGGGCRQNRTTIVAASPVGKSISTSKLKALGMSSNIEKSIFMDGFNHELSSNNPILWPGSSQSSHLLALLRATTQNPNPNPNPSFFSSMANSDRNLGLDSMVQVPSIGFGSSFWKNNSQNQAQQEQQQNGGFVLGEIPNNIGGNSNQLYQWLRSSPGANYYHPGHTPNVISSSSPSSAILDSAPVAGGEMGIWNPTLSWSDLSAANGAYP